MTQDLTLKQAAKYLDKSLSTVKRLIKEDKIVSYKDERGWFRISHTFLQTYAHGLGHEQSMSSHNLQVKEHGSHSDLGHEQVVKLLRESLDYERNPNEKLESLIEQLQKEIFNLTSEIKALLKDDKQGWQLPFRWKRS